MSPARRQLKRGKCLFSCPRSCLRIWSRGETGSAARPSSACSFPTLRLNLVLTHGIPPTFRDGVHLYIPSTTIGPIPSLSDHTIAHRWRSLPRACRRRASSPQGSSSNGCYLFSYHNEPIDVRLSFPTPNIGTVCSALILSAEYGSTGYACQSCWWSVEQGKMFFPCPRSRLRMWSREIGSAVPPRVSPLISIHGLNLVLPSTRDFPCFPRRRPHIHHRASPKFIRSRYCIPMAFTAENPPAHGQ